jgi:DNA helicase-2/ATP-dependent DNA helicase PcrA
MTPTVQQQAFLDALLTSTANLALIARAGTGKTSTILMGVAAYAAQYPRAEILVCAFNKSIATEVGEKLKKAGFTDWRAVQSSTIHAMGFGLVKFVFKLGPNAVDDKKVRKLIQARNERVFMQYGSQIEQLVSYAKGAGVGFFNDIPIGDVGTWHKLADHYDVNGLDDTSEMDSVVEAAISIYRASLDQTDVVDFDDMILFPLIKNLRVKFGKDLILLDEAQDLSRARQALAQKFLKPNGRMCVIGDDRQAIYGFAGADAAALPNLVRALSATTLPLSISWRCPKAVIRLAQSLVPDIEAAPEALEGTVEYVAELPSDLNKTDAILCRNTAPLITIAYQLIRAKIPCKVEGRAIGEGLAKLATRWKTNDIDELTDKLDIYRDREVQKAMAKFNEAKAQEVVDRVETLKQICQAVMSDGKHTVSDVVEFISNLFGDDVKGVLTLCTYHRSKGREWPRVILWEHGTRCPSKAARQDWQLAQEDNLAYVAFTRAQQTLTFVN